MARGLTLRAALVVTGVLWPGCAATPRASEVVSPGCPDGRRPVAWSDIHLDSRTSCALDRGSRGWEKVCWGTGIPVDSGSAEAARLVCL